MQTTQKTNQQSLIEQLIDHEGEEEFAYQDTKTYWTIGCGRNIDKRCGKGLSKEEISYLLSNDITDVTNELHPFPWFLNQDEVRKGILIELCFNMGLDGLLQFHQFIKSMMARDYDLANQNLLDSKWSKEVQPKRVTDISYRLTKGKYAS